MKKSGWVLYLFEDEQKADLFKIMEFKTIKELGYVIDVETSIISNWFHGLINPWNQFEIIDESIPIT